MRTVSTLKELQLFINEFLNDENNTITRFYVLFFMFEDTVYQIDYNAKTLEYTVTPIDAILYQNQLDEDDVIDEEALEEKEKASVMVDDMEVYLSFNKIREATSFSSIVEIDEMRTRYTATIEESVVEEDGDGEHNLIFTNMIYGPPTGLDGEENGIYILSRYTPQLEKIESVEYKNLPSIETIEFSNKESVDDHANILVEKGFGSVYSLLMNLAKRDIFIQASTEVFSQPLRFRPNAEIEVPIDENAKSTVYGKSNGQTAVIQVSDAVGLIENITNVNYAIMKKNEELSTDASENDKDVNTIPRAGIRPVYSYEGIQNLITHKFRIFHMICLGTCYCYEITHQGDGMYFINPKGRDDATLNEWFNKYSNIILLFNGNIANSFARVTNPIYVAELNDIDENLYNSYARLKAYTINFIVKGQPCPVTLIGSQIQELFQYVVNDIYIDVTWESIVEEDDGMLGWNGTELYYKHPNEVVTYALDLDKVMRGLEILLDKEELLGTMKRYTTKVEEEEDQKEQEEAKRLQEEMKQKENKKKETIYYTISTTKNA